MKLDLNSLKQAAERAQNVYDACEEHSCPGEEIIFQYDQAIRPVRLLSLIAEVERLRKLLGDCFAEMSFHSTCGACLETIKDGRKALEGG